MGNDACSEHLDLDFTTEDVLDVLDLPQIHTKPSAKQLLVTLSLLTLEPKSWNRVPSFTPAPSPTPRSTTDPTTPALPPKPKVRSEGVPQYITRIISSPLGWMTDDEKEQVWDAASLRLSERSGRTGMSAINRSFTIPIAAEPTGSNTTLDTVIATSGSQGTLINIQIHEPAMTEDNLGLKTWGSSYIFARKWHTLREELPLPFDDNKDAATILELGAGTGLVGIAAAAVLCANVILTDLPEIVPNLDRNVDLNSDIVKARHGSARAAILDWTVPEEIVYKDDDDSVDTTSSSYPLIVAADPIYSKDHPKWLVRTIAYHLKRGSDARVIIMIPIRDAYAEERADLKDRLQELGMRICKEETEIGYDDWSEGRGEELKEVECWMTMWKWEDS